VLTAYAALVPVPCRPVEMFALYYFYYLGEKKAFEEKYPPGCVSITLEAGPPGIKSQYDVI
jgi:hypothetical protein